MGLSFLPVAKKEPVRYFPGMDDSVNISGNGALRNLFRALQSRNYRLYFFGQSVSMIGTWMHATALGWLVYRLTNSKGWLGTQSFAAQIPIFLLASLGGVLADRLDQRRFIIMTQLLAFCLALALAILVATGAIGRAQDIWIIILLSVFAGTINAFDMPARQSLTVRLVERREDLQNAIALNSTLMNSSRMVGPAIAGFIIAHWSEYVCFGVNAATFLAVIGALIAMKLPPMEKTGNRRHVLFELREGAVYAWRTPAIRTVLAFLATLSLIGFPYAVLLPVFARDVIGGGARTYGFMLSSVGFGAIVGTLFLASRPNPLLLGRIMSGAAFLFAVALVGLSFSKFLWLSAPLLALAGFGLVAQVVAGNTLLQTVVDDDKRGRVMGLHGTAVLGMMPFGGLMAGLIAERIGAPNTVLLCGLAWLVGAMVFRTRQATLRSALASAIERHAARILVRVPEEPQIARQPPEE